MKNNWPLACLGLVLSPLLLTPEGAAQTEPIIERTVLRLSVADAEAVEGRDNPGLFLLRRQGNLAVPVTVYLRIGGSASNGVDYVALPREVTIPAGVTEWPLEVRALRDEGTEPVETVVLSLEEPVCIAIWPPPPGCYVVDRPAEAVVRIYDATVGLPPRVEIVQPRPGTVFRAPSDIPIEVVARDPDGYVPRVEFFADGRSLGVAEVAFLVPPPPGQPQRFEWTWSNAPAGGHLLTVKATDDTGLAGVSPVVNIRVVAGLELPRVWLEVPDARATEPSAGSAVSDVARVRFRRDGGMLRDPLTVTYQLTGTAAPGLDYLALPGSITFPPGADEVDLILHPLADDRPEEPESVVIMLRQPDCANASEPGARCYLPRHPSRAIVWIHDATRSNRAPHVNLLSPPDRAVYQAPVDLRLVAVAGDPDGCVLAVEFYANDRLLGVVSNRLAILEDDHSELAPGCNVVPAHTAAFPFVWVWTNVPPGEYTLHARATDNLGAQGRSRAVHVRVSAATDLPWVRILATDPVAREGSTNEAHFHVWRSKPADEPLTVFYRVGGSASPGADYRDLPGRIEIRAGQRAAKIHVVAISDDLQEGAETVIVELVEPPTGSPSYRVGRPGQAAAVILDPQPGSIRGGRLPDGTVLLPLPQRAGIPWRLETSTNLMDWEAIGSAWWAEDVLQIVDPGPGSPGPRFYRLVPEHGPVDVDRSPGP